MKKSNLMPSAVLASICLVVALLLSFVNMITGPIIKAAQDAAANAALLEVLPEGKNFEPITIDEKYPPSVTMGYKADGGFVFQMTVTGKSSGLIIMCGINSEGKIVGTKVIAEQETDSYDAKVFPAVEGVDGKYKDMTLDSFEPYLVSGATLTSRAYSEAIKAALQAFVIANGGEVDIRTPEQILQDNCNQALGVTDLKFTRWFSTEILDGVDAVYEAPDNGGKVYVVGDTFIGVNASDEVVTDVDEDTAAKALAAHSKVNSSVLTEVTERSDGIHASILKIYVTNSGNYVFDVNAEGFSIHEYDEYGSGKNLPISIKVSISADGKIIDILTVSHGESKGYGDKCATEEYYDSFRGAGADEVKISDNPTDPGVITGATYTSEGYQRAVKRAFAAFEILTGGVQNG